MSITKDTIAMPPKKLDVDDFVLGKLEGIEKDIKSILQRVSVLEVKAGMWGAIGGALVLCLSYLKNHLFR